MSNRSFDDRLQPATTIEIMLQAGPVAEDQILAIVGRAGGRFLCRVAQPGDDGFLLIAMHRSPDARPIQATRWKGVQTEGGEPGPVYLAENGGYTEKRPKSKARQVGWQADGVVILSTPW